MAKYVLISDTTLTHEYRNFPLLDFLPCAPSESLPRFVYNYLKGKARPPLENGRASVAPYSVRKIEAALLQKHDQEDVVVPHENYFEQFIGKDTEVIGVSTMDPLGLGPLTMSFAMLFGTNYAPYVRKEFEALIASMNHARKAAGGRAKLVVGGPGVWELTVMPETLDVLGVDYAFQGEAEDIACDLFSQIASGTLSNNNMFFEGFQSFDEGYRKFWSNHHKFISRRQFSKQFPKLEEIPEIKHPAIKGIVEVMRGCGIGCDFCEVTLRPLRYYKPEKVQREIRVNLRGGYDNAWLQTDEVFAYQHGRNFEPNSDAIIELFTSVMSVKGINHANPTHGRVSIPATYPELIRALSEIMRAGPANWIGVQMGIETGSDALAKVHMPNKTLPLRIGPDGSWSEIIWQGTYNLNRYYWRPAFTVQVGQPSETPEDNWETVTLINRLSNSEVDGRPFEFTVTPMQNVPLGHLKSRKLSTDMLNESQLAVYYAAYRHLAKIAARDAVRESGGTLFNRSIMALMIRFEGQIMLNLIERICKKRRMNITKIQRFGLEERLPAIVAR